MYFLIVFFLFVVVVQKCITLKVSKRNTSISDLGFKLIKPNYSKTNDYIIDVLVYGTVVAFFLLSSSRHIHAFMISAVSILILRTICILLTVLPKTDKPCVHKRHSFITTIQDCTNDYMFSGHTAFLYLALLHINEQIPSVKIPSIVLMCTVIYLLITTRSHYSIDIFIAMVLSYFVFQNTKIQIKN